MTWEPPGDARGNDWLDDWLLTRALEGLDAEEEAELEALLNVGDVDYGHYEEAAACVWLGAGDPPQPMPPDVAARVERACVPAPTGAGERAHGPPPPPEPAPWARPIAAALLLWRGRIGAGLAAGLALLTAAALWAPEGAREPNRAHLAEARTELMANAPDAVRVEWEYAGASQDGEDASGYVVWSDARQRGYMTFRDIPPNDPAEQRYHAWLFPGEQAGEHVAGAPVSVGAFNAPEDGDEVIVPIRNRLPILEAERFGITRDPPEQAQYSDRESLLLLAQPLAGETSASLD